MKEFDFDELDKAVNSLMGDVKKPDDAPATDSTVTPPDASAPATSNSPDPEPVTTIPETVEQLTPSVPSTDKPPTPPSLPASSPLPTRPVAPILPPRRGGGRFMDVVHPSSDMSSAPSASVSTRQGKPLAPVTMSDEVKPASPVVDVMAPATSSTVETVPADEAITVPADEPSTSTDPWTSPFLPDTQVEKRPLGGGVPPAPETGLSEAIAAELSKGLRSEEETTPSSEPDTKDTEPTTSPEPKKEEPVAEPETVSDIEAPTSPDLQLTPETTPAIMPAELNNDLVAIESGQNSAPLDEQAEAPQSQSSEPSSTTSPLPPTPLSVASIPPQYDEQPSSGDASHTPIYDNEAAAHQPLTHPAKKKKSWVLIVFIVIILAVGGALGALAYFLGLV